MTNYDYTNRVQLTGDSSQNAASGYGGDLDVTPQGDWPGLSADPNSQRLHTEEMLRIAGVIDGYVASLQSSGALEIEGKTTVSFGPDRWEAAVYLKDASGQVAHLVSQYTQKLIANLQAASTAIRNAAAGYDGAEKANKQSAQNQQSTLSSGSTSSRAM